MLRSLGGFVLSCTLVACSSTLADDSLVREEGYTVAPQGPGGDCTLTVVFPDEVMSKPVFEDGTTTGAHLRLLYDGHELRPGVAARVRARPDAEGYSSFTIEYSNFGHRLTYSDRFAMKAGDSVTLHLGAIQIDGWGLPESGPTIDLSGYTINEQLRYVWNDVRYPRWTPSQTDGWWILKYWAPILPAFAGHYEYTYSTPSLPTKPVDVASDKVTFLDATVTDPLAYVEVLHEAPTLPDAQASKATLVCAGKSGPIDWSKTSRASVFTTSDTTCTYRINAAESAPFKLSPKQYVQLQSHRIDVQDVTITDEPGNPIVPGTYSVFKYEQRDNQLLLINVASHLKTSTGIDVPVGSYRIETHYRSPKGADRTTVNDVAF